MPAPVFNLPVFGSGPNRYATEETFESALNTALSDLWSGVLTGSGKTFRSRSEAVAFGQAELPGSLGAVMTLEGGVITWRVPFQNGDDPLFATSPYWGVVARVDMMAEVAERIAQDGLRSLALRDAGVLPLTNIGGTGDAITADLLPSMVAAGITSLSVASEVEYIPTVTNEAANPTMTIGGTTFLIRDANGNTWPARAFVAGRSYKLRRRNNVLRVAQGSITEAEINQAGLLRLINIAGTADAITAELAPELAAQTVENGRLLRWRATATTTAPAPTMTVGGVTRQIYDTNGATLPAGAILAGRSYMAEIYSGTAMRLVYASNSAADIATQNARLDAADAKWVDRTVSIVAESPAGYTRPPSTTTIITEGADWFGVWRKSGDQSSPASETRALTANDGYWVRLARYPRDTTVQPVLNAVQEAVAPLHSQFVDSAGRRGFGIDLAGGIQGAGLGGLSVQDHIQRLYNRHREVLDRLPTAERVNIVADLGCDPTGQEDCSAILNAAYVQLAASGSGPKVLYAPEGSYRLNAAIVPRSGVSLIGAGMFLTTFRAYGIRAHFDYRVAGTYLENCVFADFGIDGINQVLNAGAYDVQTKGAFFQGFRRCVFTRLYIRNTGATSLGVDFADGSMITDNIIVGGGRLAQYGDPGGSGIGIGTGWQQREPLIISGNICIDCRNYGIFLERQRGDEVQYEALNNVVAGNICIGNGHGFGECGCDGTIITSNQFTHSLHAGVAFHRGTLANGPHPGRRALLHSNIIMFNGGAGVEWDGRATFGPRGYSSRGNRIEANSGPGHWLRGGTGGVVDDFHMDDEIIGNGGAGIFFESGSFTNVDIAGRLLRNAGDAIRLDAAIRGGSISARLRDLRPEPTQTGSITGAGLLTDLMIDGCQGVGCAPADLTNPGNAIAWGFNPGVHA